MSAAAQKDTGAQPHAQMLHGSPWQPLRITVFRNLWLATLVSNIGSGMQEIGAGWLMASLTPSPVMVALVQSATSLPVFLFALPAGTLADIFDRRVFLIGVLCWMSTVAVLLAGLTFAGVTNEWILLALTFGLGLGTAMMMPAWAAVTPEVVPREELHHAIALNTLGMNIARSIGPALAGVIVAAAGSGAVFLANACSFLVVIAVLARWRRDYRPSPLPAETFGAAIRGGMRFARHAPALHAALVRGIGFFLFASALWALMPLIARDVLHGGPRLYGVLLACVGIGAIGGALMLPTLRRRYSSDQLVSAAAVLYASAMFTIGSVHWMGSTLICLALCGMAWITVISSVQTSAQLALPNWVRSRGISLMVMALMGSLAIGSIIWGNIAEFFGVPEALMAAAIATAAALAVTVRFPISHAERVDLSPSRHWQLPAIRDEVTHERGPVMIIVHYRVAAGREPEFVHALHELGRSRRRDGAYAWDLMESAVEPGYFIEYYLVDSWLSHLRQHERVTQTDRALQERILSYLADGQPRQVTHFVRAETGA